MVTCAQCGYHTFSELKYEETITRGVKINKDGAPIYDHAKPPKPTGKHVLDIDAYPCIYICQRCRRKHLINQRNLQPLAIVSKKIEKLLKEEFGCLVCRHLTNYRDTPRCGIDSTDLPDDLQEGTCSEWSFDGNEMWVDELYYKRNETL